MEVISFLHRSGQSASRLADRSCCRRTRSTRRCCRRTTSRSRSRASMSACARSAHHVCWPGPTASSISIPHVRASPGSPRSTPRCASIGRRSRCAGVTSRDCSTNGNRRSHWATAAARLRTHSPARLARRAGRQHLAFDQLLGQTLDRSTVRCPQRRGRRRRSSCRDVAWSDLQHRRARASSNNAAPAASRSLP